MEEYVYSMYVACMWRREREAVFTKRNSRYRTNASLPNILTTSLIASGLCWHVCDMVVGIVRLAALASIIAALAFMYPQPFEPCGGGSSDGWREKRKYLGTHLAIGSIGSLSRVSSAINGVPASHTAGGHFHPVGGSLP